MEMLPIFFSPTSAQNSLLEYDEEKNFLSLKFSVSISRWYRSHANSEFGSKVQEKISKKSQQIFEEKGEEKFNVCEVVCLLFYALLRV